MADIAMNTNPPTPMNLEPLEEFVVEYAVTLVGMQQQDPDIEPLDAQQLVVSMMAALSTYARTRSDYNQETNVSPVLQLGVNTYAQALYSAASAVVDQLSQSGLFDEEGGGVLTALEADDFELGAEADLTEQDIADAFAALRDGDSDEDEQPN